MKEAKNGNTPTLFSPPFYTSRHGYRLAASLCLNGDGKGKGTHISAFISILKGQYFKLLYKSKNFCNNLQVGKIAKNQSERVRFC